MTSHVLSVVTPVHKPSLDYLQDAYDSLCRQDMPNGWSWQWLVQEDGQDGIMQGALPNDNRISAGSNRSGGAGMTRTMALARAQGEFVKVLDADDVLAAGTLLRDIEALTTHPDVGWTTSRVLDLLPDGSTVGFENDPEPGVLPIGSVLDHWREHDHRANVHPATLCIRSSLLLALGGWMALPASEDTGLLLALSAVSEGYFIPDCGLYYRKWPGQVTHAPEHSEPTEREARMQVIERRATALAKAFEDHGSTLRSTQI